MNIVSAGFREPHLSTPASFRGGSVGQPLASENLLMFKYFKLYSCFLQNYYSTQDADDNMKHVLRLSFSQHKLSLASENLHKDWYIQKTKRMKQE